MANILDYLGGLGANLQRGTVSGPITGALGGLGQQIQNVDWGTLGPQLAQGAYMAKNPAMAEAYNAMNAKAEAQKELQKQTLLKILEAGFVPTAEPAQTFESYKTTGKMELPSEVALKKGIYRTGIPGAEYIKKGPKELTEMDKVVMELKKALTAKALRPVVVKPSSKGGLTALQKLTREENAAIATNVNKIRQAVSQGVIKSFVDAEQSILNTPSLSQNETIRKKVLDETQKLFKSR